VDFRGFSDGFRPGRKPHDALDALAAGIWGKRVNWVLDADVRDFFGQLDHSWLRRVVEHRIADKRILRLIDKWLAAGVIEEGKWTACEEGSPQGASVSPLLANIYLHYVFDLWVDWWRRRHARGDVIVVRWADDFIVGFEHEQDARRFLDELRERFAKFGLELHPDKTRLIEFGRYVARDRKRRGLGKPATFDFFGVYAHLCVVPEGDVLDQAHHNRETHAGEAKGGQGPAEASPAYAHSRSGPVAGERATWAYGLLRRARQY
jgi:group II intron reverse transcriptase/maturase